MSLIHIRVGKELKKKMQDLLDEGLFSNQAEIAREGIRDLLIKYNKIPKHNPNKRKKWKE